MIDWREVLLEVATRGGHKGLSPADLTRLMADLYPGMLFDKVIMEKLWKRLAGFPEVQFLDPKTKAVIPYTPENEALLLRIESSGWETLMVGGRALKLSHFSISLLEAIGRAGPGGIACPELGASIKMDARNLHYHLLPLQKHSIILKIPVTVKKSNTYLCVLSRFVQEEVVAAGAQGQSLVMHHPADGTKLLVRPTHGQLMARVSEVLQAAPDQTLSFAEILSLLMPEDSAVIFRMLRRCLPAMVESGCVEMVLAVKIGGTVVYRFRRPYVESASAAVPAAPAKVESKFASGLRPMISISKLTRDLVADSNGAGVTLNDAREAFGLSSKAVFRVYKHLVERRFIGNSDVLKSTEFAGKERRHRLHIQCDNVLADAPSATPSASQSANVSQSQSGNATAPPSPSQQKNKRESVTRLRREQIFLEHLRSQDPPVLEICSGLGALLGERLAKLIPGSSSANRAPAVDKRTMSRMVDDLVAAGQVRQMTVVLEMPKRHTRHLVMPVELPNDDPRVVRLIEGMKELPRMYDLSNAEGQHEEKEETAKQQQEPLTIEEIKRRLFSHGFVYGTMQRLRLLHLHLYTQVGPGREFNTSTVLFTAIPLRLFLQLIGISSVSPGLGDYIRDPANALLGLDKMPRALRGELVKKRGGRMRAVMKKMLAWLVQLGLLVPTNDALAKRLSFHIPIGFRVSPLGHLPRPPDGRTHRVVDFTTVIDVEAYWAQLMQSWSCQEIGEHRETLPEVLKLAALPANWLMVQEPRQLPSKRLPLASRDFPAKPRRLLSKRHINLSPPAKKVRSSKKRLPTLWTDDQVSTLRLVFILLHHEPFVTGHGSLAWLLAAPLFPGKTSAEVRTHGVRLTWDWTGMDCCLELDAKVELIRASHRAEIDKINGSGDEKEERFVEYYGFIILKLKDFDKLLKECSVPPSCPSYTKRLYGSGDGWRRLWADWERQKHARFALMGHLDALPFAPHPQGASVSPVNQPIDAIQSAIALVKSIMTTQVIETAEVASVLSPVPQSILTQALKTLASVGFLAKSSSGKHRYRIPGTNYCISSRVALLLLPPPSSLINAIPSDVVIDEESVAALDLDNLIDGMLSGAIRCSVGNSPGCSPFDQMSIAMSPMSTSRKVDFLTATDLEARVPPASSPHGLCIWHGPMAPHPLNLALLRNALLLVLNHVADSPAISQAVLAGKVWPILDARELGVLVDLLVDLGWVEAKELDGSTYLSPILTS